MRKPAILLVALLVIAGMAASIAFLKPPKPEISLAAEEIFSIGPLEVTNAIITSWIVVVLLLFLAWRATRNMKDVPSGLQNFVEAGLEGFLSLVEGIAGERNGRRFFPLVATILVYVMISNWFGLLPFVGTVGVFHNEEHGAVAREVGGLTVFFPNPEEVEEGEAFRLPDGTVVEPHGEDGQAAPATEGHGEPLQLKEDEKVGLVVPFLRGVNTDLNATLALAITAVVFIQIWGVGSLGIRGYGSKFINFKGPINFVVGILELISEFARIISFTFRLFGNIFAGEVLILIITFLVPLFVIEVFFVLELFVGFIQAFVFAMLTLVFAVLAVAGHGEHEEHAEEHTAEELHPPLTGVAPGGEHPPATEGAQGAH